MFLPNRESPMSWHQRDVAAMLGLNILPSEYEQRLAAANRIIHDLTLVVAHKHAALLATRKPIEWYNAGAYEVDGVPISDWISDALDAGIRGRSDDHA